MFEFVARRAIAALERRWAYDAGYLREVLEAGGISALMPMDALTKIGTYRRAVPVRVYYAAKVAAAVAADCGPCAQLIVSMAEAEGCDAPLLRAVAGGDRLALGDDERLGYDLARATIARVRAEEVREAIVERWGKRALFSIANALVAAQAYPTFKYAIGYGHACTHLRAGGVELTVAVPVST